MRIKREGDEYILSGDRKEMGRVLACLLEAAHAFSRAEFFIRVGWAQGDVNTAVRQAGAVLRGDSSELDLYLPDGSEEIENPRRPRPRRQDPLAE